MDILELNDTPVRTSKNFNINNIKIENIEIPETIEPFKNVTITETGKKINMDSSTDLNGLKYGLNEFFTNQVIHNANYNKSIVIDDTSNKEIELNFNIDGSNKNLIENIQITANEDAKSTIIIKYSTEKGVKAYHNGIIRAFAKRNSTLNVIIVNFMNEQSDNFIAIENKLEDDSKINYYIIDFGGKNSITNYYSNIDGNNANNNLKTIYIGRKNQILDLNYIAELQGEKSNVNIDVQGALKDNAKKHFKGTIDFKKGCKKATGNENENCLLLSNDAKSLALPMLLCSEEDVEGNHSTSAGKVDSKELFYIMSRGFSYNAAMKLMVRAKFNKILEGIKNESLKNEILEQIDTQLD